MLLRDPGKLLGREGDDREASLSHQRRVGEQLVGFDLCQGAWFRDGMAGLDPYLGNFRVADVDRFNGRRAYRALFVAGVIDNQLLAWLHFTQMPHRDWVGHTVPDGG